MTPDGELLRQYAEHRNDAAFAELVRRHLDFVYSVALRQANGDVHLAQDATQTVFVDLARKARHLSNRSTLAGWLHTSARFAVGNAIRGEARRRIREQEATTMQNNSTTPEINWTEIGPLLDEAVSELKESDREAVLLRFFKNLNYQEVGAILGLEEDAARKRVDRALEKLREHFTRRGVTTSAIILTAAISTNSVTAAPVGLAAKVTTSALAGASGLTLGGAFLLNLFYMIAEVVTPRRVKCSRNFSNPVASPPVAAPKTSVATLSSKPVVAQVEMPVAPAAIPSKSPAAGTSAAAPVADAAVVTTFVAAPQADLKTAVLTAIHFLDSQDTPSVLRTLMSPTDTANEMQSLGATSLDELTVKMKEMAPRMAELQEVLTAVQDQTPIISPDGLQAAYLVDPPISGHKNIEFQKVDGFWYLK